MKPLHVLVFLLLSTAGEVWALPTGAPIQACDDITPQPGHSGVSQDISTIPFTLDITQLFNPERDAYIYLPGERYTRELITERSDVPSKIQKHIITFFLCLFLFCFGFFQVKNDMYEVGCAKILNAMDSCCSKHVTTIVCV